MQASVHRGVPGGSQASMPLLLMTPSPHSSSLQLDVQPSPFVRLPSSHCSAQVEERLGGRHAGVVVERNDHAGLRTDVHPIVRWTPRDDQCVGEIQVRECGDGRPLSASRCVGSSRRKGAIEERPHPDRGRIETALDDRPRIWLRVVDELLRSPAGASHGKYKQNREEPADRHPAGDGSHYEREVSIRITQPGTRPLEPLSLETNSPDVEVRKAEHAARLTAFSRAP